MTDAPTPAQEPALKPEERFVLEWLAKEDDSALGECKGASLDELVRRGLAEIIPAPRGGDWDRVRLTESGFAAARTVPPAAAPVGELRAAWEAFNEARVRSSGMGANDDDHAAFTRALDRMDEVVAAAPVTGDRETAGVRPAMWALSDSDGRWVQGYTDITQAGLQAQVERSDLRTPVWFTPLYATPPSGGGDHAAPEAGCGAEERYAAAMARELKANEGKGDFAAWTPTPAYLRSEVEHHVRKLFSAFEQGEASRVIEYAADLGNYGMKAMQLGEALSATARPAGAEGSAEVGELAAAQSILKRSNWRVDDGVQELRHRLDVINCEAEALAAEPVTSGKMREQMRDRLITAVEGECDGLALSISQAETIVAYQFDGDGAFVTKDARDGDGENA